jgi:hypothetical protein
MNSTVKTIKEAARETNVFFEADVVVVGGGPGGHSAAVAAARNGAKTVLLERYGHLGGLATGGLVIQLLMMSDGTKEQQIGGLCQEWIDRLDAVGQVLYPKKEELGSTEKEVIERWRRIVFGVVGGTVRLQATVEPEWLKCILNDMVEEAGVKLFLHSWGTEAIVEDGEVKGVIFESKSGRAAILGKVIIDGTGDGDIMASAGIEYDDRLDSKLRASNMALVWRFGGCNFNSYCDFRETNPEKHQELVDELKKLTKGLRIVPMVTIREDVVWVNNWVPHLDAANVEHLTYVEVEMRKAMREMYLFYKKYMPGFENCYIYDTASQIGTRGGRRMAGEYVLSVEDMRSGKLHEDTIAVFPNTVGSPVNALPPEYNPRVYIPYRCLLPRELDGFLVACRAFSSDIPANNAFNWIPHTIAFGEAAGTAAAIAVEANIKPRGVDCRVLQEQLLRQGVLLTGIK